MADRQPESWLEAEPGIAERERAAMLTYAPDLEWRDDLFWREGRRAYGWAGVAPEWAAERSRPAGVQELLAGRRLGLEVFYPEAFPSVPPTLYPIDPEVPLNRRTLSDWHVNGDGSLCLMQAADDWHLTDPAAELVRKASGWFVEYLLLEAGEIGQMTKRGIFEDTTLDSILTKFAA